MSPTLPWLLFCFYLVKPLPYNAHAWFLSVGLFLTTLSPDLTADIFLSLTTYFDQVTRAYQRTAEFPRAVRREDAEILTHYYRLRMFSLFMTAVLIYTRFGKILSTKTSKIGKWAYCTLQHRTLPTCRMVFRKAIKAVWCVIEKVQSTLRVLQASSKVSDGIPYPNALGSSPPNAACVSHTGNPIYCINQAAHEQRLKEELACKNEHIAALERELRQCGWPYIPEGCHYLRPDHLGKPVPIVACKYYEQFSMLEASHRKAMNRASFASTETVEANHLLIQETRKRETAETLVKETQAERDHAVASLEERLSKAKTSLVAETSHCKQMSMVIRNGLIEREQLKVRLNEQSNDFDRQLALKAKQLDSLKAEMSKGKLIQRVKALQTDLAAAKKQLQLKNDLENKLLKTTEQLELKRGACRGLIKNKKKAEDAYDDEKKAKEAADKKVIEHENALTTERQTRLMLDEKVQELKAVLEGEIQARESATQEVKTLQVDTITLEHKIEEYQCIQAVAPPTEAQTKALMQQSYERGKSEATAAQELAVQSARAELEAICRNRIQELECEQQQMQINIDNATVYSGRLTNRIVELENAQGYASVLGTQKQDIVEQTRQQCMLEAQEALETAKNSGRQEMKTAMDEAYLNLENQVKRVSEEKDELTHKISQGFVTVEGTITPEEAVAQIIVHQDARIKAEIEREELRAQLDLAISANTRNAVSMPKLEQQREIDRTDTERLKDQLHQAKTDKRNAEEAQYRMQEVLDEKDRELDRKETKLIEANLELILRSDSRAKELQDQNDRLHNQLEDTKAKLDGMKTELGKKTRELQEQKEFDMVAEWKDAAKAWEDKYLHEKTISASLFRRLEEATGERPKATPRRRVIQDKEMCG